MKKILPLIFVAVLMIFAVAQTSEALSMAYASAEYPNGDYVEYWPDSYFDGYSHVVLTYASDGTANATILTPEGWPDDYYGFSHLYMDASGLYYSTDGVNWYPY